MPKRLGFNFTFTAELIKEGWNQITIYNNAGFHRLITTGKRCNAQERRRLAARIVSLEVAVMPGCKRIIVELT